MRVGLFELVSGGGYRMKRALNDVQEFKITRNNDNGCKIFNMDDLQRQYRQIFFLLWARCQVNSQHFFSTTVVDVQTTAAPLTAL